MRILQVEFQRFSDDHTTCLMTMSRGHTERLIRPRGDNKTIVHMVDPQSVSANGDIFWDTASHTIDIIEHVLGIEFLPYHQDDPNRCVFTCELKPNANLTLLTTFE